MDTGGHPMWPDCLRLCVAAISYEPLAKTDLTKYAHLEPKALWNELAPSQPAWEESAFRNQTIGDHT